MKVFKLFRRRHGLLNQFQNTDSTQRARTLCSEPCLHHRVSMMFRPSYVLPQGMRKDGVTCKSQHLMLETGLIRPAASGTFHLLPLAQRAVEKLIAVIDAEMRKVGGQKISMPSLTSSHLWKESGRWGTMGAELFKLKDRHKTELCLGPTHEEAVTDIVSAGGLLSHKRLPMKLYQVTSKFRDEPRPRFGLLRGREFIMKDMYTFDSSEQTARDTYHMICEAYTRLFRRLQLDCVKVVGATGTIGGILSQEFHLLAETGEDQLYHCDRCGMGVNVETTEGSRPSCLEGLTEPECLLKLRTGIEVGHAFLLGTKYSKTFKAGFTDPDGNKRLMEMGCYGLGVTRILAASIEVLSSENEIRWPLVIAPYRIYVIPPKQNSKEEAAISLAERICSEITQSFPRLQDELLLDDRDHMTIGRRLNDAKKLGYPYIVIVGKRALEDEPLYELHNTSEGTTEYMTKDGLLQLLGSAENV